MSVWSVYELSRRNRIPLRRLPHTRGLLFPLAELEIWENGAELEVENLAGGGRICRPVQGSGR